MKTYMHNIKLAVAGLQKTLVICRESTEQTVNVSYPMSTALPCNIHLPLAAGTSYVSESNNNYDYRAMRTTADSVWTSSHLGLRHNSRNKDNKCNIVKILVEIF